MRGDVTEVYKIVKAMDKLNAELLFTQPHNMWAVKCSMTPVQECFKADKRKQFWRMRILDEMDHWCDTVVYFLCCYIFTAMPRPCPRNLLQTENKQQMNKSSICDAKQSISQKQQ